jgi:predicted phosphodiesterase
MFVNFRFLLYPLHPELNPLFGAKTRELTGITLFISDLHVRSAPFDFASELRAAVEREKVSNLVIDGDLYDSPSDADRLLRATSVKRMLGLAEIPLNVYWVLGSPPHDPRDPIADGVEVFAKCGLFNCAGIVIVAYHGHDLSMKGGIAHAFDRFVSPLMMEKLWRYFAGVDTNCWVIFGHTHIPGLDAKALVGNCGAWTTYRLVRPTATGILVDSTSNTLRLITIANLIAPKV